MSSSVSMSDEFVILGGMVMGSIPAGVFSLVGVLNKVILEEC